MSTTTQQLDSALNAIDIAAAALVGARKSLRQVLEPGKARPKPKSRANRNQLEAFIEDHCYEVPGAKVLFTEFYTRFVATLNDDETEWAHKQKVIRSLPSRLPYGRSDANRRYIGNLSWSAKASRCEPLVARAGRLETK